MAKGDTKTARNMIASNTKQTDTQFNAITNPMQAQYSSEAGRETGLANQIQGNAQSLFGTPLDPTVASNLRSIYQQPGTITPGVGGGGGGGEEEGGGGGGEGGGGGGMSAPTKGRWDDILGAWQNAAGGGLVNKGKLESAIPGFQDIANTGGYDPATMASIKATLDKIKGFGDTGGFDPAAAASVRGDIAGLRNIGQTGGLTPGSEAAMRDLIAQFTKMGTTGGVSEEGIGRIRGGGIFDEFAQTGGYNDRQIGDLRARATSGIPALYANENRNLNRLASVQGGGGPGLAASRARMIRGTGQSLADAQRNAETDIQGQIRTGRKWGGEQMTQSEQALQDLLQRGKVAGLTGAGTLGVNLEDLITGNKLAGLGQAGTLGANLEGQIASNKIRAASDAGTLENTMAQNLAGNKLTGLRGITDTYGQSEQLGQTGAIAGLQGWSGTLSAQAQEEQAAAAIAAQEAAAASAADAARYGADLQNQQYYAGLGSENEQYIGNMMQGGQLGSLGVMGNLYNSTPGATSLYQGNLLNAAGGRAGAQQGNINAQVALANQPGWFDKVVQGVGAGAGLLSGIGSVAGAVPAIKKGVGAVAGAVRGGPKVTTQPVHYS